MLSSNEPFWNGLSFAEAVLLHFKKIMKELTKDAVLVVGDEEEMQYWGVTEIEDFQKNPYITHIEKSVPIKKRKTREAHKNDEDLQKNENIADNKKIYLEVTLTPDRYLDHSGLEARKKLFSSKTVQSLNIHHDSGNIYDDKAIKVFYENTDIGFIMKKGSNGKVDEFCFDGNNFLEDVGLIRKNGKFILTKIEKNEVLTSDDIIIIGNLMWEKETHEKMEWHSAMIYAKNLRLGGYNDWRLPTIEELGKIVKLCGGIEVSFGDNEWSDRVDRNASNLSYQLRCKKIGFMANLFWSSTTHARNSNYVWRVGFRDGYRNSSNKSNKLYVRCVRAI